MLNKMLSPKFFLLFLAVVMLGTAVGAQEGPPEKQPPQANQPPNDDRPNLLAQLGLSQEQVQQFRRANAEHRPLMNEAQRKLREANRDLDMAIYADAISDDVVRVKLKAFQDAQAEVTRLRFMNELTIRKILTPEQLVRFRDIRRQFAEARERFQRQQQRRNPNQPRPQIFNDRQRPNPNEGQPVSRPAARQGKPVI